MYSLMDFAWNIQAVIIKWWLKWSLSLHTNCQRPFIVLVPVYKSKINIWKDPKLLCHVNIGLLSEKLSPQCRNEYKSKIIPFSIEKYDLLISKYRFFNTYSPTHVKKTVMKFKIKNSKIPKMTVKFGG